MLRPIEFEDKIYNEETNRMEFIKRKGYFHKFASICFSEYNESRAEFESKVGEFAIVETEDGEVKTIVVTRIKFTDRMF